MRVPCSAAAAAAFLLCAATGASAAFIPNALTNVTGIPFTQGDSGTLNADGNVARVFNGTGLTVGNPATPSTWTHDTSWQNGWQSNSGTAAGSLIADLGATTSFLSSMYIWNVTESGGTPAAVTRGTKTMDVYYATNPSPGPALNTAYNFGTATGWTLLASNVNVTQGLATGTSPVNAIVNLSSIPSARYIGLDLKENYSSGTQTRIGLSEVQITTVPEPTGAVALVAVAGAGLIGRRRRRA